jgi:hypothetical protein
MYEAGEAGWSLNTATAEGLLVNYALTGVNDSYNNTWYGSDFGAINRDFPSNLLCWTPGSTPAGTLISFNSEPLSYWDPFSDYPDKYPYGFLDEPPPPEF